MAKDIVDNKQDALDLNDLLVDESNDVLSDYLSISIENLGTDTKVSVTTVEDQPATYTATLIGVTLTDLHCLVGAPSEP